MASQAQRISPSNAFCLITEMSQRGYLEALVVETKGKTQLVPSRHIYTETGQFGRAHHYGRAGVIYEADIDFITCKDATGEVTVQLANGQIVSLIPVEPGSVVIL